MIISVDLAEARSKARAKYRNKKAEYTYLYRYQQIELHVVRTPCFIDTSSTNYNWITYWNPEFQRWGEACVNKATNYVERVRDESIVDRTL